MSFSYVCWFSNKVCFNLDNVCLQSIQNADFEVYDLNSTTALLSDKVCTYGVADMNEKNSEKIKTFILCRFRNSKVLENRFYRLNYKTQTKEHQNDKKKMFVYTVDGIKLIKNEMTNKLVLPNVSSICKKEEISHLLRNSLIVLAVIFILSLVAVYRKYKTPINVSLNWIFLVALRI